MTTLILLSGPFTTSFCFSGLFQTKVKQISTLCKKCPSSIWCWDLNLQPLENESPHITKTTAQHNIISTSYLHNLMKKVTMVAHLQLKSLACSQIYSSISNRHKWCNNTNAVGGGSQRQCAWRIVFLFARIEMKL